MGEKAKHPQPAGLWPGWFRFVDNTTVAADQYGFGYCGLGYLDSSVIAVPVDGVPPSEATVLDGSYPISRALHMLTNGAPTGWVRAFIDFVYGTEGQDVVEEEGFIRLWF